MKPHSQQTPRERLISAAIVRIKAGRASDPHATIEGLAENNIEYAAYYQGINQQALERLIKAVERGVQ
jgi:hypothetical protein